MAEIVPDQTGSFVPVALIGDPFARQLVLASQNGTFGMADGGMNTLDLFEPFGVQDPQGFGFMPVDAVAVVILNCLPTPLKLVGIERIGIGAQLRYPATVDPDQSSLRPKIGSNAHEIPGVRPYPKPASHRRSTGGPVLLGGVGMYQFDNDKLGSWDANLAMRFAYKADGSGPQIGVAINYNSRGLKNASVPVSSVCVDVLGKYADLADFYHSTVDRTPNMLAYGKPLSNDTNGEIAIWGSFETQCMPVKCPQTCTLTIWVRDAASTLGMG